MNSKIYLLVQPEFEWQFILSSHKSIEGAKDKAQKDFKKLYLEFLELWEEELAGTELDIKNGAKDRVPVLEWVVPEDQKSDGNILFRAKIEISNEPEDIDIWPTLDITYNIKEFELLD